MMLSFKVLSALLSYPDETLVGAAAEARAILAGEGLLPPAALAAVEPLLAELEGAEPLDAQERWVALFDRTRSLSLHLFEHVHGESRDRGQAMVDLRRLYLARGLEPDASELPDYLPLFLEFLGELPGAEARALLGEPRHVLKALRERLAKRNSAYAGLFAALEALADEAEASAPIATPEAEGPLDEAWLDAPVTFGPDGFAPNRGCPAARDALARIDAPRRPPAT